MGALDYTLVICSSISAVGAITAAAVGAWVARQVRTISGDRLGAVAERTEHLASASVAHTTHLVQEMNGGHEDDDGYNERMERLDHG